MAAERAQSGQAHAFWSGTLTFGLVSVPVDLYAAVRPRPTSLRLLGPAGQPLVRRFFCSKDGRALTGDEIVRGFPLEDGRFVVVSDEELEAAAPESSRDIELRRFVKREEIDLRLLERSYILAPAGQSAKAYHLLTETMERSGRAGIATFVMRGHAYIAAIFAREGILRAETLRFLDELRSPEDLSVPLRGRASPKRIRELRTALDALKEDALDESLLRDEEAAALTHLAQKKRAASIDVVELDEVPPNEDEDESGDGATVVDIMHLLKERIGAAPSSPPPEPSGALEHESKQALYERAKALGVPGRSGMSKQALVEAIRKREGAAPR